MPTTYLIYVADWILEEVKLDISVLPPAETNIAFLLLHLVLHHPSHDNVCPRSRAPRMDSLLHPRHHVLPQHPACTKILPFHCPISPL